MYAPLSKRGEFIDPFIEDEAAQEMQKTHASITAYERMLIAIMCLCIVIFFTGVALFIWMRKILKVKAEAKKKAREEAYLEFLAQMAANEQAQLLENAAAQSEVLPPTSPEAAKQQAETVARHRQSMLPEASDTTTNSTGSLATQVGTTGDVCSTEPLSQYSTNTSNTSNTCIILPSNTDICLQRSALLEQQPVTGISTINPHSELETTLATPARPSNVVTSYLPPNPDDLDISCSHDGDLSNIVYDAAVRGRAAPIFLEKQ